MKDIKINFMTIRDWTPFIISCQHDASYILYDLARSPIWAMLNDLRMPLDHDMDLI